MKEYHYLYQDFGQLMADATISVGFSPVTSTPMFVTTYEEDAHNYARAQEFAGTRDNLCGYDSREVDHDGGWHLPDIAEALHLLEHHQEVRTLKGICWTSETLGNGCAVAIDFDNSKLIMAQQEDKHVSRLIRSEPKA